MFVADRAGTVESVSACVEKEERGEQMCYKIGPI